MMSESISNSELDKFSIVSSEDSLSSESLTSSEMKDDDNSWLSLSGKSTYEESNLKLSIGEKKWTPFSSSITSDTCSRDGSEIFSIASFDSDLIEGSRMKILYDVEEDIVTVKKVLAEGWLLKKGSGQDFICSRRWKSRWAELAIVKLPHHKMDVPALLMYWHPSSTIPTSFIPLNKTDIMPLDHDEEDCRYRFKISNVDSFNVEDARIFSTDKTLRDEWVHVMNIAIRDYHTRLNEGIKEKEFNMRNSENSSEQWIENIQCCSNVKVRYMTATN